MEKIRLFSISDQYIKYLKKYCSNIYDNKSEIHGRKYIGVVFEQNGFQYFAPLSSPKKSDYIYNGTERAIRKSIIPIIRILGIDTKNKIELKGTIRLSNMVPVPKSELTPYIISEEQDENYKILIEKEYKFIKTNAKMIFRNAVVLYNQKANESSLFTKENKPQYLDSTLDFKLLEEKCLEYQVLLEIQKEAAATIENDDWDIEIEQ